MMKRSLDPEAGASSLAVHGKAGKPSLAWATGR